MRKHLLLYLFLLVSLPAFSQNCTLSVTISQSAPTICSGYNVTLTANASGGTAPYSYIWSTGETTSSIVVDKSGTYSVTVTDKTPGCPGVKQQVSMSTSNTPEAPTAANQTVCAGSSATLTATAPGGTYQWYDAVTGGNFLASGDTYVTPPINQNTAFYVQTTVNGCTSPRRQVLVSLSARPTVQNASICSGDVATLTASGGSSYIWYDAPSGGNVLSTSSSYTTPTLTKTTYYYVSAVSGNGCQSPRTTATVTVTSTPPAPTASNVTVCSGSPANLHATASGSIINWYSAASGGVPLISSPDYTTPPLTTSTTYYVSDENVGCESARVPVNVYVTPIPPAPANQSDTTCYNSSITLTASSAGAAGLQWYNQPNGTLLASTPSFTTPVLTNSTTYYVRAVNGSCMSAFAQVNVIVLQPIPAPQAPGAIVCIYSSATLTASSSGGGTFQWYNAATGGTLLATGASFTTPGLAANTTYFVQNTQGACVSTREAVKVTVLAAVAKPAASGTTVCAGDSASLTASGSSGGYAWYDAATGGNLLSTAQVYVTPALTTTTTYYVEATLNGCSSSRVPVKVTVSPAATTPVINGVTICPGMSATLNATGANGTVKWYNAAVGGALLFTGATFKTPVLTETTTYYAQDVSGQCSSPMVSATVSVDDTSQFKYPGNTFCVNSPDPTPTINNPNGGTFTSSPVGLVFVSNKTGEINIGASIPGRYQVTFTGKGMCTVPESQSILIALTTDATFSYNGPYCQEMASATPTFTATSSAGQFSATPAGLVFLNTSSGEIDLANSKPGTYTVTNYIAANGACTAATYSTTVTIDQKVVVNAGPNQIVGAGTTVQLSGSIAGSVTTGTWSGGTGSFSNPSNLNATYTPGPGETQAVLTLTSAQPPPPCAAASSTVTIIFTSQPASPTAQNATDCAGSSVILSATAPGGTYQWFDAATGGNLLWTGADFTTPALNNNTTYYVQTTVNDATSTRTAVTVTVNAIPAAPTAPSTQICNGTATTLTASGSTGTYQWYDSPSGGNLLSTTANYSTPTLTSNTSYYVETTVNGCTSARTQVNVTISPQPYVTSSTTGTICSGQPEDYAITANLANTTFVWSRAKVAGISNPAVSNQTTSTIAETLINTGNSAVNVTYVITPMLGTCAGPSFNYVVTVYPLPVVTSASSATICNMSTDNYAITFSGPVSNFSWSRAAVAGISNQAVSGQAAGVIREVLFNVTDAPINVTYVINYNTTNCAGAPFNLVITVNPQDSVTSAAKGLACSGFPQDYVITTNLPSSTFSWSRNAVSGISNPAVINQTSATIAETLVNTTLSSIPVIYTITPFANGCAGSPFTYVVTVDPPLPMPVASSNSPICVGSDIHLTTVPVTGVSYLWTGPNGFTSTDQNPIIANATVAQGGTYTLTYTDKQGCTSQPVNVQVEVDPPPVVSAGNDTTVCATTKAIPLNGMVSGGTTTGIWTTSGTGTFMPSANTLNADYFPSPADTTAGSVELTLSSTSEDNCSVVSDSLKVTFSKLPAAVAGPNQSVCSQTKAVQLDGQISISGGGVWSTEGSGTFSPSASQLNAIYVPSAADIANGFVVLKLSANDPGSCFDPVDSLRITFVPPPTVYAGGTRYVLKGYTLTLEPTVSSSDVHYLWSPDIDINDDTLKNPVVTGDVDRVYTLTVTDSRGCVASDTVLVKVAPVIHINNTFTPNGDGINDYWDIIGLIAYQEATVDIFDRWGQKIFHSLGYPKPWDGTYNGKPVPVGVYYYVINTHVNGQVLAGYVTVIR